MRVIIAGGRNYLARADDALWLAQIHMSHGFTEVLCGGAQGADAFGAEWAKENRIPVRVFPADWGRHGFAAGPIRNAEMAANADALIAFPGGRGTASMLKEARKRGLMIWQRP